MRPEYIGIKKVYSLELELQTQYPYLQVKKTTKKYLKDCLEESFLNSVNGVIVATGNPTEERYFNEKLFKKEKSDYFFLAWACKEAYAKATGRGLGEDFTQLDLSFLSDNTAEIRLQRDNVEATPEKASLRILGIYPEFTSALCLLSLKDFTYSFCELDKNEFTSYL